MDNNGNLILDSVVVPFSQSIITGGFVGLTVSSVGYVLQWPNPHIYGLLTGSIISTVSWFTLRGNWEKRLEAVLGIETKTAPATAYNQTVKLNVQNLDAKQADYLYFNIPYEKLKEFATGISEGKGISTREWVGNNKLFRGNEFAEFRHELIKRGYARWKNDGDRKQGAELTKKGNALMKGLVSHSPTIIDTL